MWECSNFPSFPLLISFTGDQPLTPPPLVLLRLALLLPAVASDTVEDPSPPPSSRSTCYTKIWYMEYNNTHRLQVSPRPLRWTLTMKWSAHCIAQTILSSSYWMGYRFLNFCQISYLFIYFKQALPQIYDFL